MKTDNKKQSGRIEQLLKGDRLALARVISLIEDRDEHLREIIGALYPHTGKAFVLGITGPPGAGKSTVTDRLIAQIRAKKEKVAVICIDPSSPFSGGAILGDRIRMHSHYSDSDVYIRSLGTRGKHGGLSQASKEVVLALDAAGFDWIIVETAGVGQTELDILKLAHGVCVVLVPESGDSIQVMKAGLMEIADLFVVNKADRPEADKIVRELVTMIGLGRHSEWDIPVLKTQAIFDRGIQEFFEAILEYRKYAERHGVIEEKRKTFVREEISEIVLNKISIDLEHKFDTDAGHKILDAAYKGIETPYESADSLLKIILDKKSLK